MKKIIFFVLVVLSQASNVFAQTNKKTTLPPKIESLLRQMTLEEKLGQLTLLSSWWDLTGATVRDIHQKDIEAGRIGAIFNGYTTTFTRKMQQIAVEKTRLKVPLLFGYDVIHGHKTIFPIPLAESCSWDLDRMERSARIAAIEATAEGLHWTFAPMVDISRDPRWGRIAEGAGEDTWLGVQVAKARVKGFQGYDLSKPNTLLACVKHYAAYGAAQAGREYHTVDVSERTLREIYLPPFKAALDAGVRSFMTSFNEYNGMPATGSKFLITDVLKKEWSFDGFVVTDYTSINEMVNHGVAANLKDAAELAFKAGVDMDMQGETFIKHGAELVKEKKVKQEVIDEAVRRILKAKYELGLFDDPYRYCDSEREKKEVLSQVHLDASRDIAKRSIVLLKNDSTVLPLKKNVKTVAVIGPLGESPVDMLGPWHGAGEAAKDKIVTIVQGVKNKLGKASVIYEKGCDVQSIDKSGFIPAIAAAKKADAVILSVGEGEYMSGEAASRSVIELPGVQQELIEEILKLRKPTVVVLSNGRPLVLEKLISVAPAVLETWFLGTEAGNAIADVLFGDYNPSGKLTTSFPRNVGQIPLFYNAKPTGRPENPKEKYTSKYLDVSNQALFPFGFGLSYTKFDYSDITLDKASMMKGEKLNATVSVTNIGNVEGEEVVQLYIRDLVGSVTRPLKELKGFKKILLKKGEMQNISFTITENELSFLRENMTFGAEPGEFEVQIGTNSADVKKAMFTLK